MSKKQYLIVKNYSGNIFCIPAGEAKGIITIIPHIWMTISFNGVIKDNNTDATFLTIEFYNNKSKQIFNEPNEQGIPYHIGSYLTPMKYDNSLEKFKFIKPGAQCFEIDFISYNTIINQTLTFNLDKFDYFIEKTLPENIVLINLST